MKKWCAALIAAMLVCLGLGMVQAQAEDAPFRSYNKKEKFQYVQFGNYPQSRKGEVKPVLWRVLEAGDTHALLLAEYIMDAHQVIEVTDEKVIKQRTYRRIETFQESDLYAWMNDTMLNTMFTKEEQAVLDTSRGSIFILNNEECKNRNYGFPAGVYDLQPARQCTATDYAREQGVLRVSGYSPYWVDYFKGPGDYRMRIVGVDGHMSYGAFSRDNIGIRPAILVDKSMVTFGEGQGTKKKPYVLQLNLVTEN